MARVLSSAASMAASAPAENNRYAALCQCAAQTGHVVLIPQKAMTDNDACCGAGSGWLIDAVVKTAAGIRDGAMLA